MQVHGDGCVPDTDREGTHGLPANDMVLLILAKVPEAGRVKTRLTPPMTSADAARVAAAALLDTLDAVRAVPGAQPVVAISGDLPAAEDSEELAAALRNIPLLPQRGDALGERVAAAHADTAALLPGHAVLQIGMDTPQVSAGLLRDCAVRLHDDGTDGVLGPASDGGWWALGLRDPLAARAIVPVPTSRPDTGARTADALRTAGVRLRLLPELSDVDTAADARAVAGAASGTRFATRVQELM